MLPLSIVIITYNEEERILSCIQSASLVADEIIVVDSFSSDNTKNICLQQNVRFIENAFSGYGMQKNIAVEQCTFDYVLNLDADEILSDKLVASILHEKNVNFRYDAYTINRLNRYRGQWIRHGSWYPDKKLRLFNKQKGKWSDTLVHEKVEMQPGSSRFHLTGDLKHFAYDSVEQHISKNEKYSSLSAKALYESGKKTTLFKLLLSPLWAFTHCFIFRLGFLDGNNGYIIAKNVASLSYLKNAKLLAMQKATETTRQAEAQGDS